MRSFKLPGLNVAAILHQGLLPLTIERKKGREKLGPDLGATVDKHGHEEVLPQREEQRREDSCDEGLEVGLGDAEGALCKGLARADRVCDVGHSACTQHQAQEDTTSGIVALAGTGAD